MPAEHAAWMATTVDRPGWHHYLGFADDLPVAAGTLFVRGNVGWLGAGSTLQAYRQRGTPGAIMAHRTTDAAELGCQWVVTETLTNA